MISRRVLGLSFRFTERLCTYTSSLGLCPAFTETVPWMPVPKRRLRAASPVYARSVSFSTTMTSLSACTWTRVPNW